MKQPGFTLLEAIVALVLIATTGMALFSWVNTNLISLQRVQTFQQRYDATQSGLTFMQTVNPSAEPTGRATVGHYTITWQATVIKPPKDGVDSMGTKSLFQISLYDIEVVIKGKEDDTLLAQFTVQQIGYKQVRFYDDDWM